MALENGYRELTDGRRQVRFALYVTIGVIVFGELMGALIVRALGDPADADLNLPRWALLLSTLLFLVPLVLVLRRRAMPLASTLRIRAVAPVVLRDALFIGLGISVLIDELDRLLASIIPMPAAIAEGMNFLAFSTSTEALLVIGGAVLVAPLLEELVFRGFLQGQLEAGYRDATKAVLISAVVFTVLHLNPWWALQIYLLGVVLGFLAWRTGSIWPPFLVHATNNGLATWFANRSETGADWYTLGGHVAPQWLLVAAILANAGIRSLNSQGRLVTVGES